MLSVKQIKNQGRLQLPPLLFISSHSADFFISGELIFFSPLSYSDMIHLGG